MTINKVSSGDRFAPSSEFQNILVDLVDQFRREDSSSARKPDARNNIPVVKIKPISMLNTRGSAILQFNVVGLGDLLVSPQDNEIQFRESVSAESASPSTGGRFAIAIDGAPDNNLFSAVISGVVQVKINRTSTSHDYAASTSGQYDYLTSGTSGLAEILWVDDLPALAIGETVHTGTGAPGGGTGSDGDYYRDTVGEQYYGPKTAGSWGSAIDYKTGICWAIVVLDQAGAAASNSFATIAVSGQSDVVADSSTDTLTLVEGSNITITTNAGADSITIAATVPVTSVNGQTGAVTCEVEEADGTVVVSTTVGASSTTYGLSARVADATHTGILSLTTQTIVGTKTFSGVIEADAGIDTVGLYFPDTPKSIFFGGSALTAPDYGYPYISASLVTGTGWAPSAPRPTSGSANPLNIYDCAYCIWMTSAGSSPTLMPGLVAYTFGAYDYFSLNGGGWLSGTHSVDAIGNIFVGGICVQSAASLSIATADIDADAVTNAKLANAAAYSFKGNLTSGSANPTDITLADLTAETTPSSGDFVLGMLASGQPVKIDIDDLPGGGAGDVTAASNFGTDNRLIRSDGTTKGVQASGITVDDSDNVTGVATLNKVAITAPATGSTLTIADGKTATISNTITITATDGSTLAIGAGGALGSAAYLSATTIGGNFVTLTNPGAITFPRMNADNTVSALSASDFRTAIGAGTGGGDALTTNPLSQFAATTSAQLAGVISDETGTGLLVFGTAPTFASTVTIGTAGGTTGAALFKGATSGTVTVTVAAAAGTHTIKLPTADGTAGQVLVTDGSGQWSWTSAGGSSTPNYAHPSGFRLGLQSGVAVSTSDQTASTIYLNVYTGDYLLVPNTGATDFDALSPGNLSLAIGTLTSGKNYDVFCWNNGGTPTLALSSAWTNDTTRADALTTLKGIQVNNATIGSMGAKRGIYLGTFRTDTTTTTLDTAYSRFVWNIYNRVARPVYKVDSSTASWTYTSTTWRQSNADTTHKVETVTGFAFDPVRIQVDCVIGDSTAIGATVGVGVDSTTTNSATVYPNAAGSFPSTACEFNAIPSLGYHAFNWLERTGGGGTVTFYNYVSGARQAGMTGTVMA